MTLTVTTKWISYEAASRLVEAAFAHAASKGWRVAAVIVDPAGHPVALGRMDGVPAPVVDYATDKAYTAGTLGKSSRAFGERMNSAPGLTLGAANRPRTCAWDGGLAIYEDGTLIGGIGVSGAAGPEDVECAERAVASLGLDRA